MISINNFINGEFVPPNSNQYLDVYEPATGLIYSNLHNLLLSFGQEFPLKKEQAI